MIDDGGNVFPMPVKWEFSGMTLRDYFAAKAMHAELIVNNSADNSKLAECAYATADAMLEERIKC